MTAMASSDREYAEIRYEVTDRVAVITLDRPESMNAISRELDAEVHAAVDAADADPGVRAIVLTGSGKAFTAGYDMRGEWSMQAPTIAARLQEGWANQNLSMDKHLHFMRLGTPIIAAVNGWCMGGGFWWALAADVTLASERAVFGQPEVRQIANSSFLLAALCGWKNAARYSLTGDHFDADEALRIGVVNQVVPHDELVERAVALGRRISHVPDESVRLNKAIITQGLEAMGLRAALYASMGPSLLTHMSKDAESLRELNETLEREGMKAYLKQRDEPFLPEPGGPRSRPRA